MIKITDIHTIEADNYCFILNTEVPTEKKDGGTGSKVIQTFHTSIPAACVYALNKHPELRDCQTVQECVTMMEQISKEMEQNIKTYAQDIQVIKVLPRKEKGKNKEESDEE